MMENKKSLMFRKGTLNTLKNDDFVVRFVASSRDLKKIIHVFIYATYEYITEVLYLDPKDEKKINKFFEERLEEWKKEIFIDKILKKKCHYLVYGDISRIQARRYINEEYNLNE